MSLNDRFSEMAHRRVTRRGLILAGGITGMVSAQSAADATGLTEEQLAYVCSAIKRYFGD